MKLLDELMFVAFDFDQNTRKRFEIHVPPNNEQVQFPTVTLSCEHCHGFKNYVVHFKLFEYL